MKKLYILAIAFALSIAGIASAQESGTIYQLSQFKSTTTGTTTYITQNIANRVLKLTGYNDGCAQFGPNGILLSTGVACGSGSGSATTSPAGNTTEVQFNDGGIFGAKASFFFDKITDTLSVPTISNAVSGLFLKGNNGTTALDLDSGNAILSASNNIILATGGYLGINNFTPAYNLDVTGTTNLNGEVNFNYDPGTSGFVLQSKGAGVVPQWVATSSLGISGGGGSGAYPGGTSTQVQYRLNGTTFGGIASSTIATSTGFLGLGGITNPLSFLHVDSKTYTVEDPTSLVETSYDVTQGFLSPDSPTNMSVSGYKTVTLSNSATRRVYSANPATLSVPSPVLTTTATAVIDYAGTGYTADGSTRNYQITPLYVGNAYVAASGNTTSFNSGADDNSGNPYSVTIDIAELIGDPAASGYLIKRTNDDMYLITAGDFSDTNSGWGSLPTLTTINSIAINLSWTAAAGVDGYRLINSSASRYQDTVSTTALELGSGTVNPISTPNSAKDPSIISDGELVANNTFSHTGLLAGFFGNTPILKPVSTTIVSALNSLGLCQSCTIDLSSASDFTGLLPTIRGGTNQESYQQYGLVYANAAGNTLTNDAGLTYRLRSENVGNGIGINIIGAPTAYLDVNGSFALRQAASSFTTGGTSNNVDVQDTSSLRVAAGSAVTITGFTCGANSADCLGRLLFIQNTDGTPLVLKNQNTGSSADFRIVTQTGGDVSIAPFATGFLKYDSSENRWHIVSLGTAVVGNSAWTIGASRIFNATTTDNVGIGTTSPISRLDVWGTTNIATGTIPVFNANTATGNVGIGTSTATNKLTVAGLTGAILSQVSVAGTGSSDRAFLQLSRGGNTWDFGINSDSLNSNKLFIRNLGNTYQTFNTTGEVGFGTTTPTAKVTFMTSTSTQVGFLGQATSTQTANMMELRPALAATADFFSVTNLGALSVVGSMSWKQLNVNRTGSLSFNGNGQTTLNCGGVGCVFSDAIQSLTSGSAGLNIKGSTGQTNYLLGLQSSTGTTTSAFDFRGWLGIGTSTPQSMLHVSTTSTSTIIFDSTSVTQGTCLKLKDSDGSGYTYLTASNGVLTASITSCQ